MANKIRADRLISTRGVNAGKRGGPGMMYTAGAVAVLLGCAARTVSKWFDMGRLSGYRFPPLGAGSDRRISWESLVAFCRKYRLPFADAPASEQVLFVGCGCPHPAMPAGTDPVLTPCLLQAAWLIGRGMPYAGIVIDLSLGRSQAMQLASLALRTQQLDGVPIVALACEDEVDCPSLKAAGFTQVVDYPHASEAILSALKTVPEEME